MKEEIPKVTIFTPKITEYFFEQKKTRFFIVKYKNNQIDEKERCQVIEKMFSQTKAPQPKKKKKKVKVENVEKIIETNQGDSKPNNEDMRKQNMKFGSRKSRNMDTKNKSAVGEPKVVAAPTEPEVVPEQDKESSEEEIKLVDTIKPLKEELKLMDCIGLFCMDDYHTTLFVEKYFNVEFESNKYK